MGFKLRSEESSNGKNPILLKVPTRENKLDSVQKLAKESFNSFKKNDLENCVEILNNFEKSIIGDKGINSLDSAVLEYYELVLYNATILTFDTYIKKPNKNKDLDFDLYTQYITIFPFSQDKERSEALDQIHNTYQKIVLDEEVQNILDKSKVNFKVGSAAKCYGALKEFKEILDIDKLTDNQKDVYEEILFNAMCLVVEKDYDPSSRGLSLGVSLYSDYVEMFPDYIYSNKFEKSNFFNKYTDYLKSKDLVFGEVKQGEINSLISGLPDDNLTKDYLNKLLYLADKNPNLFTLENIDILFSYLDTDIKNESLEILSVLSDTAYTLFGEKHLESIFEGAESLKNKGLQNESFYIQIIENLSFHRSELFKEEDISRLIPNVLSPPIYLDIYTENNLLFFDILENLSSTNQNIFTEEHIISLSEAFESESSFIFRSSINLFSSFIEDLKDHSDKIIEELVYAYEKMYNKKDTSYYSRHFIKIIKQYPEQFNFKHIELIYNKMLNFDVNSDEYNIYSSFLNKLSKERPDLIVSLDLTDSQIKFFKENDVNNTFEKIMFSAMEGALSKKDFNSMNNLYSKYILYFPEYTLKKEFLNLEKKFEKQLKDTGFTKFKREELDILIKGLKVLELNEENTSLIIKKYLTQEGEYQPRTSADSSILQKEFVKYFDSIYLTLDNDISKISAMELIALSFLYIYKDYNFSTKEFEFVQGGDSKLNKELLDKLTENVQYINRVRYIDSEFNYISLINDIAKEKPELFDINNINSLISIVDRYPFDKDIFTKDKTHMTLNQIFSIIPQVLENNPEVANKELIDILITNYIEYPGVYLFLSGFVDKRPELFDLNLEIFKGDLGPSHSTLNRLYNKIKDQK